MVNTLGRAVHRMRPPGGRHLRTFTSLAAAGLGEAVLPTLSLIALVRLTGTETSGQVIFAQSVATVWFLLCDPCLENAAQRFVPIEQQRSGRGSSLFMRLIRWDVAIGVAAACVGLLAVLTARLLGSLPDEFAFMFALAIITRGAMASYGTAGAAFALTDRLRALGVLRMRCALLSFGLSLGGLFLGGPLLYLAGQAAGALVMAVVSYLLATRGLLAELGPAVHRVRMPSGMIAFTVKTSMGTSVAGISDSGILTLAGLLGGPTLVTILKIASAPGRFYANLAVPVAAMLYPRIIRATTAGAGTAPVRRDIVRTILLLTVAGAATLTVALPTTDTVIGMAYGPQYAHIGVVAVVLLGGACVKGSVCWSNVLPLALGKPGWRLAYLSAEGAMLLGMLLAASWTTSGPFQASLCFAWGTLAVAALGTGFWIASLRRITDLGRPDRT
ncbi:hypothetical protein AB0F88_11280 [Streptosporangium sp. NPDC023963]|uniref:lipopolysaccharide biosynthesis protein n=1 Tax=Streptosporangium sp. NPDC023963 TaxID=3155608 RepID=UPI00342B7C3C